MYVSEDTFSNTLSIFILAFSEKYFIRQTQRHDLDKIK